MKVQSNNTVNTVINKEVSNQPETQIVKKSEDKNTSKLNGDAVTVGNLTRTSSEQNVEKVNKIKEQIKNGSFKVNPEAIADKIIKDKVIKELI